jgi:hypothetical protein
MTTGTELQEKMQSQALKAAYAAATQRLAGTQQSLQRKGVGATFLRVARRDSLGDMGIIGNLLIGHILTGAVVDSIDLHGLENHLDDPMLVGIADAYTNMEDEARNNKDSKRTKVDGYPEGRRKGAIKNNRKKKALAAFAAVAGRGKRFSQEVEAELASMFDLLDMVGAMQQQGVRAKRPHKPRLLNPQAA